MATDGPEARQAPQARAARTRRALLDATLRLIARRGLGAVRFRDVAAEAGVSLGVTTYHFPTRRDLLSAAVDRHLELRALHGLAPSSEPTTGSGPIGPIDADALTDSVIELLWQHVHPDRDVFLMSHELALEATRDPDLAHRLDAAPSTLRERLEGLLEAAGSGDPSLDAEILAHALDGLGLAWIQHPDDRAFDARLGRSVHRLLQRFC